MSPSKRRKAILRVQRKLDVSERRACTVLGQAIKMTGESLKFGIDTTTNPKENVETLLNEAGLTLGELRLMEKTTEKVKPFAGLVEAVIE